MEQYDSEQEDSVAFEGDDVVEEGGYEDDQGGASEVTGAEGPRIVINPTTFSDEKDALCVAWNEGIRVYMETNEYDPESEPTDKQRSFLSDTPYADDEVQMRRTILARIATFDTSVDDPTDDQLAEVVEVLRGMVESGFTKTDDEAEKCLRLAAAAEAAIGAEPIRAKGEDGDEDQVPAEDDGGEGLNTEDSTSSESSTSDLT